MLRKTPAMPLMLADLDEEVGALAVGAHEDGAPSRGPPISWGGGGGWPRAEALGRRAGLPPPAFCRLLARPLAASRPPTRRRRVRPGRSKTRSGGASPGSRASRFRLLGGAQVEAGGHGGLRPPPLQLRPGASDARRNNLTGFPYGGGSPAKMGGPSQAMPSVEDRRPAHRGSPCSHATGVIGGADAGPPRSP